jgi:hypothetical protein
LSPPTVCKHSTRNAKQPRQRVRGDIIQPSPRDLKGTRERIGGGVPIRAREEVGGYTIEMLLIETLELLLLGLGHPRSLLIVLKQ